MPLTKHYTHKIVIEIDGSQHYTEEGRERDAFRTEILEGYDLKVIRFTNYQIDTNFSGVCKYIDEVVKGSFPEAPSRREAGGRVENIAKTFYLARFCDTIKQNVWRSKYVAWL